MAPFMHLNASKDGTVKKECFSPVKNRNKLQNACDIIMPPNKESTPVSCAKKKFYRTKVLGVNHTCYINYQPDNVRLFATLLRFGYTSISKTVLCENIKKDYSQRLIFPSVREDNYQ
ncbi:hypothetical protein BpHYR1_044453 [Brachionus plicatilis]|uniref:Uncharacterized protein n=1 Tax=Brachionus plicatilis TaxID=10195 RepID=A0A3M7PCU1_BRAPC|nr:hypothetical protein BpHYR1_044453 [Brachionus plicatilis]